MKLFFLCTLTFLGLSVQAQEVKPENKRKHSFTLGYGKDLGHNRGGHLLTEYRYNLTSKARLNLAYFYSRQPDYYPTYGSDFDLTSVTQIHYRQRSTSARHSIRAGLSFKLLKHFSLGGDLILGYNQRLSTISTQIFTLDEFGDTYQFDQDAMDVFRDTSSAPPAAQAINSNNYLLKAGEFDQITTGIALNLEAEVPIVNGFSLVFGWHPSLMYDKTIRQSANIFKHGDFQGDYDHSLSLRNYGNMSLRYSF